MKLIFSIVIILILSGVSAIAAEISYPVFPLAKAPQMDGKWDGSVWENIPVATGFRSLHSGSFAPMRQTVFKMSWYGNSLYIVVKCDEPQPDKIKTDPDSYRNGWYEDDHLEFFFSKDKSTFRQFVTNSQGALWVSFASLNTEETLQSVAFIGTDYWSVEIKIPFSKLNIGSDFKGKQFWFNLGRVAISNPENEKNSCFAPVNSMFADVIHFTPMTFKDAPTAQELVEARKTLDCLGNWISDRLQRISTDKEKIPADRQKDDSVRQLLALKKQAKQMLESKNMTGASELIRKYDNQIAEISLPVKQLAVEVLNRNTSTNLFLNGKELQPASGKGNIWNVSLSEGLNIIGIKVTIDGKTPGLRLRIPGQPELQSRWRVGSAADESWLSGSYDDRSWKVAQIDKDGYLVVPAGFTGSVCFRQIVLWGRNHYSGLPCLQPKVREWGFSEKSMETLFHMLYSPEPLTFALENYEFLLDVPKGFSLLPDKSAYSHTSQRLTRPYRKLTVGEVKHKGQPYTRYRFSFEPAFLDPTAKDKSAALIPLLLDQYKGSNKLCKFYFRRLASGNLTEVEQTLPVRILPPINGRMLKNVAIQQYVCSWLLGIGFSAGPLFPEHFEKHMRQAMDAGFNSWSLVPTNDKYAMKIYDRVINRGGEVDIWGSPQNYPFWGNLGPHLALGQLLETIPDFRARYFGDAESNINHGEFCRTHAINQAAVQFQAAVKTDIGTMLKQFPKATVYWADWEQRIWREAPDKSYCFCDNCKKAFRIFATLPDTADLSDDSIAKNYRNEWKAFREIQEGRINGMVRRACNELGLKYMLYDDAFNDPYWLASKDKIDIVFTGWPGDGTAVGNGTDEVTRDFRVTQQSLDERMTFYREKLGMPQVRGQLFASVVDLYWIQRAGSTKDGFIDAKSVKSMILRVTASFHGGVDLGSAMNRCAGQLYYIGEATRLIATYEHLFYNGKREDTLAASEQLKYPNLLVLTKGDERLVLLFNETSKPITVHLYNQNLKSGQNAAVFGNSRQIKNPQKMTVSVAAGDVTAVHIK